MPGCDSGRRVALSVCQAEPDLYEFSGFYIVPDVLVGNFLFLVVLEEGMFFYEIAWEFCILRYRWRYYGNNIIMLADGSQYFELFVEVVSPYINNRQLLVNLMSDAQISILLLTVLSLEITLTICFIMHFQKFISFMIIIVLPKSTSIIKSIVYFRRQTWTILKSGLMIYQ